MADVILDPTTRAPSASWQTVLRLIAAALVAKLALWLSGYGVDLSATDQVALVSVFVALSAALGTEARDRGWPVLRVLLVVPLVLASCSLFGLGETTPAKSWSVALTSYESAARGMAAWCAQPEASRDPCVAAAQASRHGDLVILATEAKLREGSIQDAELAAATSTLKAMMPLLQRAAGGN